MANPNIVNTTSITGVTSAFSGVLSSGSIVISAVPVNHVYKLNSVVAANKSLSAATVTVVVSRSSIPYHLAYQIPVPTRATLVIVDKSNQIYLNESDILSAQGGTFNAIDVLASFEDIQ